MPENRCPNEVKTQSQGLLVKHLYKGSCGNLALLFFAPAHQGLGTSLDGGLVNIPLVLGQWWNAGDSLSCPMQKYHRAILTPKVATGNTQDPVQ
eukprot:6262977-Amphidinium_carterae.1